MLFFFSFWRTSFLFALIQAVKHSMTNSSTSEIKSLVGAYRACAKKKAGLPRRGGMYYLILLVTLTDTPTRISNPAA